MVSARRFHLPDGQLFAHQYYHIYNARLEWARDLLKKKSESAWGQIKYVPIEQLNASLGTTEVYVVGTLFKVMPKQPSILREDLSFNSTSNFTSDEDTLILHETDENVQVIGDIDVHTHVTGIPVALLGHQVNGGAKFNVSAVCYAGLDLNVYSIPKVNGYSEPVERLLIVSGFEFGFDYKQDKQKENRVIEGLKRMREYILDKNQKVVKIVVAGNSVASSLAKSKFENSGGEENDLTNTINQVFEIFDKYIFTIAQSGSDLSLMPGKNDPTSYLLPQQPFHPKILPRSGMLENVHPVTNPCILEHKDLILLGTSGENVEAIRQHSRIEFSTTALKNTLEWGHMAPSAPDNLSCFPFKDKDPFVVDFEPDVYFTGNQPEFAVTTYSTSTKEKIQLVSVPTFVETQSCVVIDLKSLEAELINFAPQA